MPLRSRTIRGVLACALVLAGCTAAPAVREPGSPVTADEAEALARLLQRNYQRGGADFVVTAPYGDDAVLTLAGEVDFRRSRGTAQLADGSRTATVAFSADSLWISDAPGLAEALEPTGATWLRRPLVAEGRADLLDVLVRVVLDLARTRVDDPRSFRDGDWTWEGQRSIDSRLSSVFADGDGATVAVDAADDLLRQYATPLPGQPFEVTVTLAGHGPVSVALPAEAETADAGEHPSLAGAVGF